MELEADKKKFKEKAKELQNQLQAQNEWKQLAEKRLTAVLNNSTNSHFIQQQKEKLMKQLNSSFDHHTADNPLGSVVKISLRVPEGPSNVSKT